MENHDRLIAAAHAIGKELRDMVVFVGGCTVHLYLDDGQSRAEIRPTEDVDVIIEVMKLTDWYKIEDKVRSLGFQQSSVEDDPICRYRKDTIIIDFMPTDESILGFANKWYPDAISNYHVAKLTQTLQIKYIALQYFLMTKFAAFNDRGNNDVLSSKDIEDILNVVAGRGNIEREVLGFATNVKSELLSHLQDLISHPEFDYVVDGSFQLTPSVAGIVKSRINNMIMFLKL